MRKKQNKFLTLNIICFNLYVNESLAVKFKEENYLYKYRYYEAIVNPAARENS